jgi:plastocyanin
MTYLRTRFLVSLAALAVLVACGSSGSGGNQPGGGGTAIIVRDGGVGGPNGATVTMTSNGVSPSTVTIAVGQTVTFVNNDNRSHEMASNPHPQHGSCPSMEAGLGVIAAGQTKVTHNFGNAGTCGYHDHQDDTNSRFQGTIVVQ